jgi:glycine cleavage system protein P-like pyridoxal-binding family
MPRKVTDDQTPTTPPYVPVSTTDAKLAEIAEYLRKMNNRDRVRTVAELMQKSLNIVWLVLLLVSAWYIAFHGADLLKAITDMSVKSAANYTQQGIMDQMTNYLQGQKK